MASPEYESFNSRRETTKRFYAAVDSIFTHTMLALVGGLIGFLLGRWIG